MKATTTSSLWQYLSDGQRELIEEGYHLLDHAKTHLEDHKYRDYSFVVFPFAKAYEGFLKQIFLDVGFINEQDYKSDHFRLGKVMSPNLMRRLGNRSVYNKICNSTGCELAEKIWSAWKRGRNQVFHYFPHNLKSLTLGEAEDIISQLIAAMEQAVDKLSMAKVKHRLSPYSNS